MFARSIIRNSTLKASSRRFISFDAASQPRIRIGSVAPNFKAPTTAGEIDFHQYLGESWGVLFSHPADFTPVCTTELGAFAQLKPEFDARNVKLIGLSAEGIPSHKDWIKDIEEVVLGGKKFTFPIIGDETKEVAYKYDMVDENGFKSLQAGGPIATIRSVFIIDPKKTIRLVLTYPASVGRNTSEVLRVIDSLQKGDAKGVVTPVNWNLGDDVIIPPSVSNEAAKAKFGEFKQVKPYLRFTKA
ncbi:peroxiredoxin 1 [Pichia californica]|uniref:Peroxiredoxin 1 n=1 Tax=Pichia californica TaxID=460514 RepID=A0A9P7BGH9_9ASCO|nr:peroxiredoxin 1 [[Candida] californica]KAG0690076.1 peroxiredoxin 1 [[Candida] californica]